jgi:hypothetical protein
MGCKLPENTNGDGTGGVGDERFGNTIPDLDEIRLEEYEHENTRV